MPRTRSPRAGAPASCGLPELYRERFPETARRTAEVAGGISDLQFTDAYRVPFQYSRVRAPASQGRRVRAIVVRRDAHRSRRQPLLRSYRLLRRQRVRLRLLQGLHGARPAARARPRPGARSLSPGDRLQRETADRRSPASTKCRSTCRAPRRSCRRCGSRATTRAARTWCASAAPITAGGATCSRASAIRCRRTRPTRLKDMSEDTLRVLRTRRDIACVLVNPLQALHPNAGAPADSALVDSRAQRAFRPRGLCRLAQATARGLQRAQHRSDLRRGVRRLPPRAGRGAGIFRRQGRHGHLRQDARRRPSGRRGLRAQGTDEALPRRSAGRTSALRAAPSTRIPT